MKSRGVAAGDMVRCRHVAGGVETRHWWPVCSPLLLTPRLQAPHQTGFFVYRPHRPSWWRGRVHTAPDITCDLYLSTVYSRGPAQIRGDAKGLFRFQPIILVPSLCQMPCRMRLRCGADPAFGGEVSAPPWRGRYPGGTMGNAAMFSILPPCEGSGYTWPGPSRGALFSRNSRPLGLSIASPQFALKVSLAYTVIHVGS